MTIIGIDLGTTNSLVAYWTDLGAIIIPNALGTNLTPSVVSVDDNGEILVGQIAKERLITHPHLTAATFKRYMGTEKKYLLGTHNFTPEELSSFVIRSLKADAEAHLGEKVEEAVISVPAYFNDAQRKATKRAAELAGLKVERLISEPTAAALAYGIYNMETEPIFMVFDLGGGTFDVSILELFEGVIEVKAIAGDNFLGGEDFTNALVTHFIETNELNIELLDLKTKSAIYKQAERCKCNISQNEETTMSIRVEGKLYETKLDRSSFEKLVSQLIQRLRNPIERALRDAALQPEALDAVVLVGGATRMPVIRTAVSRLLRQLPYININPDEAIALGAAIQVALKERNEALSEVILTDVCPYTLGTSVSKQVSKGNYESGYYFPIIERNTPIPVSKIERLYTISDNQSSICIDIYQGESRRVEENILLGEISLQIPASPAGEQSVDVRYTYDINGILEVEVTVVNTGIKKRMVIKNNSTGMSDAEIEQRLKVLENIKIHPRERAENRLLLAKGERIYQETLGYNREYIGDLLRNFEGIMARQNEREIKKAAEKLKKRLEELENWML